MLACILVIYSLTSTWLVFCITKAKGWGDDALAQTEMVSSFNEELIREIGRDYHLNSDEFECDSIYFRDRAIYLDYEDIIDSTTNSTDSISN